MLQLSTVVEIHERHTQSLIYISKGAQAGDIFGGYFSWHHGLKLESKDIDWNYINQHTLKKISINRDVVKW